MTVSVDGVVYFRVSDPVASVANVSNADYSTRLLAQTTLRNVLGTKNLAEVLSDREGISHSMQVSMRKINNGAPNCASIITAGLIQVDKTESASINSSPCY